MTHRVRDGLRFSSIGNARGRQLGSGRARPSSSWGSPENSVGGPSSSPASSGSSSGIRAAASVGSGTVKSGGRLFSSRPAPLSSARPGRSLMASRPKWIQELLRRAVGDGPARRPAPAARPHPADLHQHVERAGGGGHAADLLDLGARHRLVVGDDGQRLQCRLGQAPLLGGVALQQIGQVLRRAERPLAGDLDEVDAAAGVEALQLLQQRRRRRRSTSGAATR